MVRIKWYQANWPYTMEVLKNKISKDKFSTGSNSGFLIDKYRKNLIEGRYIEKIEIKRITESPIGEISEFTEIYFQIVHFILSDEYPQLEIHNSPRSLNQFLNKLQFFSDFKISVEPIEINLYKWTLQFEKNNLAKISINSIQISNFDSENQIHIKTTVNGNYDLKNRLKEYQRNKYSIDKIHSIIEIENFKISLNLQRNGSAQIIFNDKPELIQVFRNSLAIHGA
ncbi:hypothetical protein EHR01_10620 [Leptospira mtsangambouensis]|uniref:Uncharacterized protein n=1 Tax=Leptospira mtsangambouensis TaxID=2484912 RepID=A0ABY2NZA5_9LEPT|nr:hypothetical protein [Leptospira mtsangambouensis]TGM74405.1 hypothetical protein EHR01_10620 [Leptospira mtsangambouensis]